MFVFLAAALFAASFYFAPEKAVNLYTMGGQPPVLLYHHVVETEDEIGVGEEMATVTAEKLEKDLRAILAAGYSPVLTEDVAASAKEGRALLRKAVIIQFDDGYESNLTLAQPVLAKLGFRAEVYVATALVGSRNDPHMPFMTWDQLRELRGGSVFRVYSHGDAHKSAFILSNSGFKRDLSLSFSKLSGELGGETRFFAYPLGDFSENTMRAAEECGAEMQMLLWWGVKRSMSAHSFLLRVDVGQHTDALEAVRFLEDRVAFYISRPY